MNFFRDIFARPADGLVLPGSAPASESSSPSQRRKALSPGFGKNLQRLEREIERGRGTMGIVNSVVLSYTVLKGE